MIIDGIEFRPVRKHYRVIPDYYVSKCAKVWNSKRQRYVPLKVVPYIFFIAVLLSITTTTTFV